MRSFFRDHWKAIVVIVVLILLAMLTVTPGAAAPAPAHAARVVSGLVPTIEALAGARQG